MAVSPVKPVVIELAPEVGRKIRAAQDQVLSVARELTATGDPLAPMFGALSAVLEAQYHLAVDAAQTMRAGLEAIHNVQSPITAADIRRLNAVAANNAVGQVAFAVRTLTVRKFWWIAVMAGVGGVLLLSLGVAGGWVWRGNWPGEALPGFTCADQADGSRICYKYVRDPAAIINPAKH